MLHLADVELNFLKNIPNLITLDLWELNLDFTHLAVINELTGLQNLVITSQNAFEDFSSLNVPINVTTFRMDSNTNVTLPEFTNPSKLTRLTINSLDIQDGTKISSLTNLEVLTLGRERSGVGSINVETSEISNVEFVRSLQKLKRFYVSSGRLTNLGFVKELPNLERLWLDDQLIEDISPLSTSTKLSSLDLSNNQVSDVNILSNLPNLEYVRLNNNSVRDISMLSNIETVHAENQEILISEIFTNAEYKMMNYITGIDGYALTPADINKNGIYDPSKNTIAFNN